MYYKGKKLNIPDMPEFPKPPIDIEKEKEAKYVAQKLGFMQSDREEFNQTVLVSKRINEWCNLNSQCEENLFVKELREKLNDNQIVFILDVISRMCPHCWDNYYGCYCWKDD